jgi:glycine cleavage system H protein
LVNDDPYGQGWIAKIKPTNPEEINLLLKGQAAVDALTKVANEKGIKCG